MHIFIKYGPLAYTFFTRAFIKNEGGGKFFNLMYYIWTNMGLRSISIFVLYLTGNITIYELFFSLLLYVYIFLLFTIFYEIGYLHNDFVSKKEKNGTKHIKEDLANNFFVKQIVLRTIIGTIGILPLYFIDVKILICFMVIIIFTGLAFIVHNFIRNYFYNFFTFFLLRFLKFITIIIPIYYLTGTFENEILKQLIVVFLLYQHYININVFDIRLGGTRILPYSLLQYGYQIMSMIIMYFISGSVMFLGYSILFFILLIISTPKKYLELKNNR